ncbi:extradiol dioxygenase [Micromonospora rosaria]|uniref:Extradiol dioxygenase n=1 Tax=Micromonospora rosaria TaxID=47874 RepID=A0A136PYD5_9ACTN|nr:VOC family protein [Micromonospora rosaria]KXK63284.1 extradiol dioxygenase [Micromonospora rosaria]
MPTIQPTIVTPDVARLHRFYESVLGAVEVSRTPQEGPVFYLGLAVGDTELGLVAAEGLDLTAPQRILLTVGVADVDELLDRVTAAGGRVLGPPNDMPWGQRVAHVEDPDGNKVNLTHPL